MANPEKGELSYTVEGVSYTLRPSFNACCQIEDLLGDRSFDEVLKQVQQGRLSGLRCVVWCVLWERHRDEIKTLEDAGTWIERVGGIDVALDLIYKLFRLNLDAAIEASGAAPNPPDAQDGTSAVSSSVPVESA